MPQDTAQRPCLQKAHERQRQGEKDRQCREAVIRSINASAGLSALTRPAGAAPPLQARDEQTRRFAELTDEAKASLQVGVTQESSRVDVQGPRARDTEGCRAWTPLPQLPPTWLVQWWQLSPFISDPQSSVDVLSGAGA